MTIALGITVMAPGETMQDQSVELAASRLQSRDEITAYERVLGDALEGNSTLFARQDYVQESWRILDPVLKAGTPIHDYEPNTWGASEADRTVSPPGGWQNPTVS